MTNIDDSTQTPPGYWFGVIEGRLHERMRDALADLGLRRGSWRILHTLADGPATTEELAERLPHGDGGQGAGRQPGHDRRNAFTHGYRRGAHPGWRSQEPRDEQPSAPEGGRPRPDAHEHPHADTHGHSPEGREHDDAHGHHHHGGPGGGFEQAFERGYVRGFDRGFAFGAVRGGHPVGPFAGHGYGYGPFPGGHAYGAFPGRPFPGGYGYGPFPGGDPAQRGHRGHRRGHRIQRVLAEFVERGWVWFDGDRATLTDEGRAAHDRAFERVQTVRAELANGIAEGDYAVTMATLETMARNLGWRPAGQQESGSDSAPSMDA